MLDQYVRNSFHTSLVKSSSSPSVVRVPLVVRKTVSGGARQTLAFHVEMSSKFC